MQDREVVFVAHGNGGYFVRISVKETEEGKCTINLKGTDLEDFEFLLGIDIESGRPLWFPIRVAGVVISLTTTTDEVEITRDETLLNYDQVVEFFKKFFKILE